MSSLLAEPLDVSACVSVEDCFRVCCSSSEVRKGNSLIAQSG